MKHFLHATVLLQNLKTEKNETFIVYYNHNCWNKL